MNCPRDGLPLERHVAGPAELYQCRQCYGIWVGKSNLEAILRRDVRPWQLPVELGAWMTPGHADGPANCLCTGAPVMQIVHRTELEIDLCPDCSAVWLDGGELAALMQRARSGSRSRPYEAGGTIDGGGAILEMVGELVIEILIGVWT